MPVLERAPSVLTSWTRTIVRALEAREVEPTPLLVQAGLDPVLLSDPNAYFPVSSTSELWRLAAEATRDPAFGLFASRFVSQTTFHALGYAVMASATLREVFERFVRYGELVSDAATPTLEDRDGHFCYRLEVPPGPARPADEAIDAMLSLIVRTARMLSGGATNPLEVQLLRPEPKPSAAYPGVFRAPVRFAADTNVITYASAALDARLPSSNPELAHHNEALVAQRLARLAQDHVATRVQALLAGRLASGEPRPADVARELGLSTRSLQRRLADEATTFKEVLAETRLDLARAYLHDGHSTVTEVAFLLGFADTSSFARAFRRWTGTSPSEYRRH